MKRNTKSLEYFVFRYPGLLPINSQLAAKVKRNRYVPNIMNHAGGEVISVP
jgi:hypothetical protein